MYFSQYFLPSISSSWKAISLKNDNSTFVALSKGSKVGIRYVYLAAFEYFRPVILRFDRPIRIKHFMSVPGLLIKSPGYEDGV